MYIKSFTITVHVDHKPGDSGVLVAAGMNVAGYAMYIENNTLQFHYNHLNKKHYHIASEVDLKKGKHSLTVDFLQTGINQGVCRLIVDGKAGSGMDITSKPIFSAPAGLSIGRYAVSPIVAHHKDKGYFHYTGKVQKAVYNLARPANDHDLMLELEEEFKNE